MNDKTKIDSLCGKILLFLHFENSSIKADRLLYFIALCDFSNNGNFNSKNIRNINSYVYYLKDFSKAASILSKTGLIIQSGNNFLITSIGEIFCEEIIEKEINSIIIKSIKSTILYCKNIEDLSDEYEKLSNSFILSLKDKKI